MGSTTFHGTAPATYKTAGDAYRSLVEDAVSEYGHDPYNGTISTTSGVFVPTDRVLSSSEAGRLAGERIYNLGKFGNCEALRVGAEPLLSARTVTRDLVIPSGSTAEEAAAVSVALRPGERVASVTRVRSTTASADKVAKSRTVVITTGKEKTETRFFIVRPHDRMPVWASGHPTQATARAALIAALPKKYEGSVWDGDDSGRYEIISMTRRADGSALVTADATLIATKARYDIVVEKRGAVGEQTSWLFYGYAGWRGRVKPLRLRPRRIRRR